MGEQREYEGWIVHESGPPDAEHTVLLLPGALCSAMFYDDLLAQPTLRTIRFVATTLPGFAGTEPLDDISLEAYAVGASRLASELGCDAVVGHSMGANVAIEMAAQGFAGPLVLLAPSFSRTDESLFPRALDRLASVLGHIPYAGMLKVIGVAVKGSLPAERRDVLIADLRKNDPRFLRRSTHTYLGYLDRHGSVAARLCESGARAWIVFGDKDDIGITDEEREVLGACVGTELIELPDVGHFTHNEDPARIAELLLEATASPTSA